MSRPKSESRQAGFTMIELLTVLLVGLILMTLAAPEIYRYYLRSKFEGLTREVAFVMQKAKYQAIKDSQEQQVCGDADAGTVTGLGRTINLPDSISFGAPGSEEAITMDSGCFVFETDGSVEETGSFRFADVRGNFLEVRVDPQATARVQVRKYDETAMNWFTRDQGGKAWTWNTGNVF